jgi:hypothetical protein
VAKLVTIDEFKTRFGGDQILPDQDGVNERIHASLESTTTLLASELRSAFIEVTDQVDEFFFSRPFEPSKHNFIELLTRQGFIIGAVEIRIANTIGDLADQTPIPPELFRINSERGLIHVVGSDTLEIAFSRTGLSGDGYLSVTYDAGFETSDDSIGLVYDGVPDWLKELAFGFSIQRYNDIAENVAGDTIRLNSTHLQSILMNHVRYEPQAIRPMLL